MPLTITIPVSQPGLPRLRSSIDSIEFLGGLQKHTVLFVCAPSTQHAVAEEAGRIRAICPNTFIETLPREPEPRGRFGAFNMIFRDTVEVLAKRGNKNPWMWWEEDMTAILGGWADRMELEYHQKGKPFLGVRRPAAEVMRRLDGSKLPDNDPQTQGDYMVAVGIYPWNFKDGFSTMYRYPDMSGNMPTDVTIRHEVNRHLQHTDLIGHHYKTHNYRREGGRIVCDDFEHQEGFPKYGGEVSPMAFVVHGCKDGSLSQLILSEAPSNVQVSGIAYQPSQASNAELLAVKAELEQAQKDIQRLNEQWAQKEMGYADEIERLKEQLATFMQDKRHEPSPVAATEERAMQGFEQTFPKKSLAPAEHADIEITEKSLPTPDQVVATLKQAGKKIMLPDLVADFKCNKQQLRELIESDPRLHIPKNGPPWVGLSSLAA